MRITELTITSLPSTSLLWMFNMLCNNDLYTLKRLCLVNKRFSHICKQLYLYTLMYKNIPYSIIKKNTSKIKHLSICNLDNTYDDTFPNTQDLVVYDDHNFSTFKYIGKFPIVQRLIVCFDIFDNYIPVMNIPPMLDTLYICGKFNKYVAKKIYDDLCNRNIKHVIIYSCSNKQYLDNDDTTNNDSFYNNFCELCDDYTIKYDNNKKDYNSYAIKMDNIYSR